MRVHALARLVAVATLAALVVVGAAAPVDVVIDTDIATDFDDTLAVAYVLSRPDLFNLKLIQVSTYNTTMRAQVVCKILVDVGRADVPVAVGRYTGDQGMPQYPIAASFSLSTYTAAGGNLTYGTGVLEALMAAATPSRPLYIVEIAPATSLGDVLAAQPSLAANCVCVAMSGSIYRGYGNSSAPSAEYNVVRDIAASQAVYAGQWARPFATAPLDTTIFMQIYGAAYGILLAANDTQHKLASTVLANYQVWYDNGGKNYAALLPFSPTTGTSTMYDMQAAWMAGFYATAAAASAGAPPPAFPHLVAPSLPVAVTDAGYTAITAGAPAIYPAVGFVEADPYNATQAIGAECFTAIVSAG